MWVSCRGWDTEGRQRLKGSDRQKAGDSAKVEGCESILSERFPLCSPCQGPLGPLGAVYLCQAHLLTLSFALGSASKAGSVDVGTLMRERSRDATLSNTRSSMIRCFRVNLRTPQIGMNSNAKSSCLLKVEGKFLVS